MAYHVQVPEIKIFKHRNMDTYVGPISAANITKFLTKDSKSPVNHITKMQNMEKLLFSQTSTPKIIGIFLGQDVSKIRETREGGLITLTSWQEYVGAANALRR